jgi:hypothetical protein
VVLRFKARRQSPALKPQGELTPSERRVVRLLAGAMEAVLTGINETRLVDAVAHSTEAQVADLIPVDPWYDIQAELEAEFLAELLDAGSRVELPSMQKAVLRFAFDRARPESAAWARERSAALVREITESQRQSIRDVIALGQQSGLSPQNTARTIRQTVGLTSQQGQWVSNFHARELSARMAGGAGLDDALRAADAATGRYQSQIHRYRSMTIARTEIMAANSAGRQQAWGQGLEGGWISPTSEKEWIAEADACEICAPLNGTKVGVNDMFPVGSGEPPAHPNCRCDVLLIPKAIPADLASMSGAELDTLIGDLLGGALLPTVPTAASQPAPSAQLPAVAPINPARHGVDYFTGNEYAYFIDKVERYKSLGRRSPEDTILKSMLKDQGFDAKPTVVDDVTFQALRDDKKYTYMGRGMSNDEAVNVEWFAENFRAGELFAGRGVFGNGTYMSPSEDVVQWFSRYAADGTPRAHGTIVDSLLKPNAKVIDYDDAYRMMQEATPYSERKKYFALGSKRPGAINDDRMYGLMDVGRWAVANGYDAIRIPNPVIGGSAVDATYYNVLNRGALVVRRDTRGRDPKYNDVGK